MHPQLNSSEIKGELENLKYFWPGHSAQKDPALYWHSENFPLSMQEADQILFSLQNQNLSDLECSRLLIEQGMHMEDRRYRQEMTELENFVSSELVTNNSSSQSLPLRQAQKNLLWFWEQEERLLDLDALSRQCQDSELHLLDQLHEETICKPKEDRVLKIAEELLPAWKKIFLNASLFIDSELPFLIEGQMQEELLEEFTFQKSTSPSLASKQLELPLWKILGISLKSISSPLLHKHLESYRILYVLD